MSEHVRVKTFSVTSRNNDNARVELENKINEFLSTFDSWYFEGVTFNMERNYLPMTTIGEYEETWTAIVSYGNKTEDE